MNKKQLIIAAMAAVLSVTGASATSYITDIPGGSNTITNGGSGTFNIDPLKVNGSVGYRAYDRFEVGSGDTANLNYAWTGKDLDTFINLVQNQNGVNIQGIVNSVKNGAFHDGHAVFITPGGLTIGSSGVLNVGRLSVATPNPETFNNVLMKEYNAESFRPENINQVSQLKQDGNAAINVQGYIFSRNGVDLPGTNINVSGKIINGMVDSTVFDKNTNAEALFNSLVNTENVQSNGSMVFLHSFDKGHETDGINVSGKIVNLTQGQTTGNQPSPGSAPVDVSLALTSAGQGGIKVSGQLKANGKLSVYNKNGDMNISGTLTNKNGELALTNGEQFSSRAGSMTLTSDAVLGNANGDVTIVNNGKGALTHNASATAVNGNLSIVNDKATNKTGGLTVTGQNTATNKVRIQNHAGKLTFSGDAEGRIVLIRNAESGTGMEVGGSVSAEDYVQVENKKGDMLLTGTINAENGHVSAVNRNTAGKLTTASSSNISTDRGYIAIRNDGSGNTEFNGTITATNGDVALNNTNAGNMVVNGTVKTLTSGNLGIINDTDTASSLTVNSNNIASAGALKVANKEKGSNGFTITDDSQITSNGRMDIYNKAGQLTIDGDLITQNGDLYVISRDNSTGIEVAEDSTIEIAEGSDKHNLVIKNKDNANAFMDLNGNVYNKSQGMTAINNYGKGDMHVGGKVTSKGNMGIINRAKGGTMTVDAEITANGNVTNIKNEGRGNMTVAGTIDHTGRLNILGNTNKTTLSGTINNLNTANKGDSTMTYAISRADGTGLEATSDFTVNSTKGNVTIANKGANGMKFAGTIDAGQGQVLILNEAGDMLVTSDAVVDGNNDYTRIWNTGEGMTVESTNLSNDVLIVNKGSKHASVPSKYNNDDNFREKLKN